MDVGNTEHSSPHGLNRREVARDFSQNPFTRPIKAFQNRPQKPTIQLRRKPDLHGPAQRRLPYLTFPYPKVTRRRHSVSAGVLSLCLWARNSGWRTDAKS